MNNSVFGPSGAARCLSAAAIFAAVACPAVVWIIAHTQDPPSNLYQEHFATILSWSVLALVLALAVSGAPRTAALPRQVDPAGFTAWVAALAIGIALLVVPAGVLAWRAETDTLTGWTYAYLNKRWLIASYGLWLVTTFVLPVAVRRCVSELPDAGVDTRREVSSVGGRRSGVVAIAGLTLVLALVWFFAGPPWNVERHHRAIDFHEQVHLGPLQAISKGHLPFVGPASTQYGPGSQMFTYAYMQSTRQFDIVGAREASLAIHFLALFTVAVMAWRVIDWQSAIAVVLLAITYSPLTFFQPTSDGVLTGAFGWGNAARYLGTLVVVPLMAVSAARARTLPSWPHVVLGLVWGVFAWVSQENLSATLLAGGLVLVLLWLTRTVTLRTVGRVVASGAAGFLIFWAPLLGYYTLHDAAGEFLHNFFLVARAVAMGFSNAWWFEGPADPGFRAYRFTPVVIGLLGVLTLWHVPTLRLCAPLDRVRVRFLSFLAVLAACYMTALYRSDSSHLLNTMIALPFVLTLALRDLPAWATSSWLWRLGLRAAIVAGAVSIYPLTPALADIYPNLVKPASTRFQALPPLPPRPIDDGVAFRRATPYLSDEPAVAPGTVPMRVFLEEASALHTLVGNRRTYVAGMGPVYTGLVYFMADLRPARFLYDRETMVINNVALSDHMRDLQARLPDIDCVIARERETTEAQMFLAAYPDATVVETTLTRAPLFVLLRPGTH